MGATQESLASWRQYRRLAVYIQPYRAQLALVVAISLASTALGLVQPYVSRLLIDRALMQRDMRALIWITALLFGATVLSFAFNILASYRYVRLSAAMLFDLRLALFRHLQTLSPRFYAANRLGDLMSRLNNDAGEVQRVSADAVLSVLSNIAFLIGSVVMMLTLNWRLFFAGTFLIPVCVLVFLRYQTRLTNFTKILRERSADLGSFFVDSILGMRVVVSLNATETEAERFRTRNDAFVDTMLEVQMASFLSGAGPGTLLAMATSIVFLYGGWMIVHGQMTIGTLVAFLAYHTRLLSPVQNLMSLSASLASARVSLVRLFELFDTPPEVKETAGAVEFTGLKREIRLQGVGLRHDRDYVIRHVSLAIPAGSYSAIVGPSGAGKTTLAELLARYLDPSEGGIELDGRDLREFALAGVRQGIMLVDQSPFLFNDTIAGNIAWGLTGVTPAQVAEAGRAAGLDELIARLPQGYETRTGERGLALSAGERQRIALARAMLRRPGVLILDEPTSALDNEMEKSIAQNLRKALPGATLIVITHRAALAEDADYVIEVGDGGARMRACASL
ncbi:MAG: ABC transporter ATP-binding protein [Candidatus Solibacter sp.]